MKNVLRIHFSLIVLVLLQSCTENEPAASELTMPELNGEYHGTFIVQYSDNDEAYTNPVTVSFSGDKYSTTIGENRLPAGGSGTFEVTANTIIFHDENFWTADFDWNLILSGEYAVSESNTTIILTATKNDLGTYRYELTK